MYASLHVFLAMATESQKWLQSDAQFSLLLHTTSFFESCLYKLLEIVWVNILDINLLDTKLG